MAMNPIQPGSGPLTPTRPLESDPAPASPGGSGHLATQMAVNDQARSLLFNWVAELAGPMPSEPEFLALLEAAGLQPQASSFSAALALITRKRGYGLPPFDELPAELRSRLPRGEYERLRQALPKLGLASNAQSLLLTGFLLWMGYAPDAILSLLSVAQSHSMLPPRPEAPGGSTPAADGGAAPASALPPPAADGGAPASPAPPAAAPPPVPPSSPGNLASQHQALLEQKRAAEASVSAAEQELATLRTELANRMTAMQSELGDDPNARRASEEAQRTYLEAREQSTQSKAAQAEKQAQKTELAGEIPVQEQARQQATDARDQAQQTIESASDEIAGLEGELASVQEDPENPGAAASERDRLRSLLNGARQRKRDAERRKAEAEARLAAANERLTALHDQIARLETELAELATSIQEADERARLALEQMDAARGVPPGTTAAQIADLETRLAAAEERLLQARAELGRIDAEIAGIEARLAAEESARQAREAAARDTAPEVGDGGAASSLDSVLGGVDEQDRADGLNCLEASLVYAEENEQDVLLLEDPDLDPDQAEGETLTHHAVVVNSQGMVTFDGSRPLIPPVPVETYVNTSGYQRFSSQQGVEVGPVPPSFLTDAELRARALAPGGALDGVPAGAVFRDPPVQVPERFPTEQALPDDNVPPVEPPVYRVDLSDPNLPPYLADQIQAANSMAGALGLGSGVSLDPSGQYAYVNAEGILVQVTPQGVVPYGSGPSVLQIFDGVRMDNPVAVQQALDRAAELTGQGARVLPGVDQPLTAEQVAELQSLGYTVAVVDTAAWSASACRPLDDPGLVTSTGQRGGSASVYLLIGGPELDEPAAIETGTAAVLFSQEASQSQVQQFVDFVNHRQYQDPVLNVRMQRVLTDIEQYGSLEEAWAAVMEIEARAAGTVRVGPEVDCPVPSQTVTPQWTPPASFDERTNDLDFEGLRIDAGGGRVELGEGFEAVGGSGGLVYDENGQPGYAYENVNTGQVVYVFGARQVVRTQGGTEIADTYWVAPAGLSESGPTGGLLRSTQTDQASGTVLRTITLTSLSEPAAAFTDLWYAPDGQVVAAMVRPIGSGNPLEVGNDLPRDFSMAPDSVRATFENYQNVVRMGDANWVTGDDLVLTEEGAVHYRLPDTQEWICAATGRDPVVAAVSLAEAELGPIDLSQPTSAQIERITGHMLGENWLDLGLTAEQLTRRDELLALQESGSLLEGQLDELNSLLMISGGERDRRYGLLIDGLLRNYLENEVDPAALAELNELQALPSRTTDQQARLDELQALMAPVDEYRSIVLEGLIGHTRSSFAPVYHDLMYDWAGDPAAQMTVLLSRCSMVERAFMIPPDALNLSDMALQQQYALDLSNGVELNALQMQYLSFPTNSDGLLGEFRREQLYRQGMLAELEGNPQLADQVAAELGVSPEQVRALLSAPDPSALGLEDFLLYVSLTDPILPENPAAFTPTQRLAVRAATAVSYYESQGFLHFDIALADARNRYQSARGQYLLDRNQVNRAASERDRGVPVAEWIYNRGADVFNWTGEEDITTTGGGELSSFFGAYYSEILSLEQSVARLEEFRSQLVPGMSWTDRKNLMLRAGATQDAAGFALFRSSLAAANPTLERIGAARGAAVQEAHENLGEYVRGVEIASYTLEGIFATVGMGLAVWTGGGSAALALGLLGGGVGGGAYHVMENLASGNPNLLENVPGGLLRGSVNGFFAIGGSLLANSIRLGGGGLVSQMSARFGFGTFAPNFGMTAVETGDFQMALIAGIFSTAVDIGGEGATSLFRSLFRGVDVRPPTPDEAISRLRQYYGLSEADMRFVLGDRNLDLESRLAGLTGGGGGYSDPINFNSPRHRLGDFELADGSTVQLPARDIRVLQSRGWTDIEVVPGSAQNAPIYRTGDGQGGFIYFTMVDNQPRRMPSFEQVTSQTFPANRLTDPARAAEANRFLQMHLTHGQMIAAGNYEGAMIYFRQVIEPALDGANVSVTRTNNFFNRQAARSFYDSGERVVSYDGRLIPSQDHYPSEAFVMHEEFGHFIQAEYAGGPLSFDVPYQSDVFAAPTLAELSNPDFVVRIPAAGAPNGELVVPAQNFLYEAHLRADALQIPASQRTTVQMGGVSYSVPNDWFNASQNLANLATSSDRGALFTANSHTLQVYNQAIRSAAFEVDVEGMMWRSGVDPLGMNSEWRAYHIERSYNPW
ncbi:MAG: hypothetical protein AMXMBFR33_11380 [Candidatus Xenobia bacterium]